MPLVDVAMARSLRPAAWELIRDAVARSVAESLTKRDILTDAQDKITDAKTAFSSWDNCMKAAFCKWPVIGVIIVGSLIILSVVWCIVRCCCCGMSCCCSCFQCLKCCGNCCGCCDPPGGRKHKYLDEPYVPPHHDQSQGYRSQAPMQAHYAPAAQSRFEPQQYAEFDLPKKGHGDGDALPVMPSWEGSKSRKVFVEQEEVEMSNLKKAPTSTLNDNSMKSPSPVLVSPLSVNYDRQRPRLPGSSSGLTSSHSQQDLLLSPQSPGYGQPNQAPYGARNHGHNNNDSYFNTNRQSAAGFGLDDPYDGHAPMSGANGYAHAGQRSQPYEAPAHQPYGNVPFGASGVAGAAGVSGAMAMRNQSTGPYDQQYGAPPVVGAAMGSGGRQSPAPARGRSPYGPDRIHEQFAEMPAISLDDNVNDSALAQQKRSPISDQAAPRELPGSTPPEGYGMRRAGTGDNSAPSPEGGRPPYGMDPRMRNSPGPSQTLESVGENPYAYPPRGSPTPRNDQGYGRGPQPPLDNVNKSYPTASPRHFSPGPNRQYSPAPDGQRNPGPPPPSNTFDQSPPRSPFTNNSGFDFDSGYSRSREDGHYSPPAQAPTTAAYPGQRTYQPR